MSRQIPEQFVWIKVCLEIPFSEDSYNPVDTGLK